MVMKGLGLQLHPEKTCGGSTAETAGVRVPGVYVPQEAQYCAESSVALYVPVAVAQDDAAAARPDPGDDECSEQRGGREADHREAEPSCSRLGELFPDGHVLAGIPQDVPIRVFAAGALVVPARRAPRDAAGLLDSRAVLGNGSVPTAWGSTIPGARHIRKVIVKPRARKRRARFERVC